MRDVLQAHKELIYKINSDVRDIKTFLIGTIPEESCDREEPKENCVDDTLRNNTVELEKTVKELSIITEYLRGGQRNG